jgi:hypothetical protein
VARQQLGIKDPTPLDLVWRAWFKLAPEERKAFALEHRDELAALLGGAGAPGAASGIDVR